MEAIFSILRVSDSDFNTCQDMEDAAANPRDELTVFQATVKKLLLWFYLCLYPGESEVEFAARMEQDIDNAADLLSVERLERGYIGLLGERLERIPDKHIALRRLYEELAELCDEGVSRPNLAFWVEDGRYRWRQSALRRRLLPGIPFAGMGRMHVVNRQADANPIVNEAGPVANARVGANHVGDNRPGSHRRFLDVLERRSRSRSN